MVLTINPTMENKQYLVTEKLGKDLKEGDTYLEMERKVTLTKDEANYFRVTKRYQEMTFYVVVSTTLPAKELSEEEIEKQATEYHKKCDPLNENMVMQAHIRQGYLAGIEMYRNWLRSKTNFK